MPMSLARSTTNPNRRCSTGCLSSTTQPSRPRLKHKGNISHATSNKNSTTSSKCGRLKYGFLRVRCEDCHHERLVAFSCKRRGFCPSCGARRMAESAALLIDEVFPKEPIRQWVLSFPFQLRFLLARHPELMGKVWGIFYRTLSTHLIKKAGHTKATAQTGLVTLIQRFGSALNLNVNFHMLFLDGVYADNGHGKRRFHRASR